MNKNYAFDYITLHILCEKIHKLKNTVNKNISILTNLFKSYDSARRIEKSHIWVNIL